MTVDTIVQLGILIISLLGFFGGIISVAVKQSRHSSDISGKIETLSASLNGSITTLTTKIESSYQNVSEFKQANAREHDKIWERISEQGKQISEQNQRIAEQNQRITEQNQIILRSQK